MTKNIFLVCIILLLSCFIQNALSLAQESPKEEKVKKHESKVIKPVKAVAAGVSEVGKAPKQLIEDTVAESKSSPILGTVEGIRKGSGPLVKSTIKGAYKVATLGMDEAEEVEVENPKNPVMQADGKGDPTKGDPTKFKISF